MTSIRTKVVEYRNNLGYFHREDGPTIEDDSGKYWYVNGALHRLDGPAVEYANGNKKYFLNDGNKKYFLNGKEYSFEEWDRLRKLQVFI
jgi:hypothetical protein